MGEANQQEHSSSALGAEAAALPEQFTTSLRTLFDVLDEHRVGAVSIRVFEQYWGEHNSDDVIPGGILAALRRVAPPNGLLTYDRLLSGVKIALLQRQAQTGQTPSQNLPMTAPQPTKTNVIPPSVKPTKSTVFSSSTNTIAPEHTSYSPSAHAQLRGNASQAWQPKSVASQHLAGNGSNPYVSRGIPQPQKPGNKQENTAIKFVESNANRPADAYRLSDNTNKNLIHSSGSAFRQAASLKNKTNDLREASRQRALGHNALPHRSADKVTDVRGSQRRHKVESVSQSPRHQRSLSASRLVTGRKQQSLIEPHENVAHGQRVMQPRPAPRRAARPSSLAPTARSEPDLLDQRHLNQPVPSKASKSSRAAALLHQPATAFVRPIEQQNWQRAKSVSDLPAAEGKEGKSGVSGLGNTQPSLNGQMTNSIQGSSQTQIDNGSPDRRRRRRGEHSRRHTVTEGVELGEAKSPPSKEDILSSPLWLHREAQHRQEVSELRSQLRSARKEAEAQQLSVKRLEQQKAALIRQLFQARALQNSVQRASNVLDEEATFI